MKILFVCENYIPHYGGAEVVFKNLAECFVKEGHKVNLVTRRLPGTKKYEVINGVKVHRVNSLNTRYLFSFTSIPKVLKLARKADLIQTTTFNGAPPAWLGAKLRKKPVVLTVHEVWVNKWHKVTELSKFSCFVHNFLERMIYTLKFDKYVCVSNATKKDLLKLNIKPSKALTIYNGVDYEFWNPDHFQGEEVRKKLNLEKKFVYFTWGRPGTSKGFEYALKAVPLISKNISNSVFLLMMGSVDKYKKRYQYLKSLVKKLKIADKVKIVPSAPYSELGDYIAAADCVVIPSIAEGFGYTTTEACAMNKPVVVSEIGSLPEVVSNKFLLVKARSPEAIAEGVLKVKNNDYEKTSLKKFLWSDSIKQYLEEYHKL